MNKKRNKQIILCIVVFTLMLLSFSLAAVFYNHDLLSFLKRGLNVKENITSNYIVKLKENDIFTLDNDTKKYLINLVDNVTYKYDYSLSVSEFSEGSYQYKVVAYLKGENDTLSSKLFETNEGSASIKGNVIHLYNSVVVNANEFYNRLGEFNTNINSHVNGKIELYLVLDAEFKNGNLTYQKEFKTLIGDFALSEETKFNKNNNVTNYTLLEKNNKDDSTLYLVITIEFILAGVLFLLVVILVYRDLTLNTNDYDMLISNILAKYDHQIVTLKHLPDLTTYNVLPVMDIKELIDASDNLELPINFVNVIEHKSAIFFVYNDTNVYMLKIKK